jgi:hypothetical protein
MHPVLNVLSGYCSDAKWAHRANHACVGITRQVVPTLPCSLSRSRPAGRRIEKNDIPNRSDSQESNKTQQILQVEVLNFAHELP